MNDTSAPTRGPLTAADATALDRSPFDWFAAAAACHADRPALDDGARQLTYAALRQQALALGAAIAAATPPGALIALLAPNDARLPLGMLACFAAGRAFAPVDPVHPQARNQAILALARPASVLAPADLAPAWLPGDLPRIDLTPDHPRAPDFVPAPMPAGMVGFVTFTSGSTGQPKGVAQMPHAMVRAGLLQIERFGYGPEDRVLSLFAPGTIAGLRDVFAALYSGACLHSTDFARTGIEGAAALMQAARITRVGMVPSVLRALLRMPNAAEVFAHLRTLRLAGEPLAGADVGAAQRVVPDGCLIQNDYGSTETAVVLEEVLGKTDPVPAERVAAGRPVAGYRLALEEDGSTVAAGEPGELVVRGAHVALGLWQDGALNPDPFPPDPAQPGARIYRMGDLFRVRPDGVYEVIGRLGRQVKIDGVRVEPEETEAVLRALPYLADAAVIARPRGDGGMALVGFVQPKGEPAADLLSRVRADLAARLPAAFRPGRIHPVARIPRLPGQKTDLAALGEWDASGPPEDARLVLPALDVAPAADQPVPPEIRAIVRAAWEHALGGPPARPDVTFAEAGGSSLILMLFSYRVERALGRRLPPGRFDTAMTEDALARAVAMPDESLAEPIPGKPRIFVLLGLGGDGPHMARLRAHWREWVDAQPLEHGFWKGWVEPGFTLDVLVDRLADKVQDVQPQGDVMIAGYSLGGLLAELVAVELVRRGRKVPVVGILDIAANLPHHAQHLRRPWYAEPLRLVLPASKGGGADGIAMMLARILTLPPFMPVLRHMVRVGWQGAGKGWAGNLDFYLYHRLSWWLLDRIVMRWRRAGRMPGPLAESRVLLFRTKDHPPGQPEDLFWGKYCRHLEVIAVGGDHTTMLNSPNMEVIGEKLGPAVLAALRGAPA